MKKVQLLIVLQVNILLAIQNHYGANKTQRIGGKEQGCYKRIIEKNKTIGEQIKGISFSGQMHGLVLLDENGDVLRPAILWNDGRTQKQCDYLNNVIGREKLSQYTGNIALSGFTGPKVLWVKENEPEIFSKIAHILLPKDYIRYKLTGDYKIDVADASGTLFLMLRIKHGLKKCLKF